MREMSFVSKAATTLTEVGLRSESARRTSQVVWLTVHIPVACEDVRLFVSWRPARERIRSKFAGSEERRVNIGIVCVVEVGHWDLIECAEEIGE